MRPKKIEPVDGMEEMAARAFESDGALVAESAYRRGFQQGVQALACYVGENGKITGRKIQRLCDMAGKMRYSKKPYPAFMDAFLVKADKT